MTGSKPVALPLGDTPTETVEFWLACGAEEETRTLTPRGAGT